MFNVGARVQEILDMRIRDMQLINPYQVHLFGKGRKERLCPLWKETAHLLQSLLTKRVNPQPDEHVFLNHRKQPLTRFGVRYLLAKYYDIAKINMPTLINKKLHPHVMRHSTAVHLLKSGADIVTICHWLGHANINTTNRYISVDLEMKRKAIENVVHMDTHMDTHMRHHYGILINLFLNGWSHYSFFSLLMCSLFFECAAYFQKGALLFQ